MGLLGELGSTILSRCFYLSLYSNLLAIIFGTPILKQEKQARATMSHNVQGVSYYRKTL